MTRKTSCIVAGVLSAAVLLLNVGQGHAQTPGAICEFDAVGICEVDSPMFDNGGLIGIGITSPGVKLHLAGTDANGYAATIQLQNQNDFGANAFIAASDGNWDAGAGKLLFGLGGTAPVTANVRMVIDSDGRVGIGTTDPVTRLHVAGGLMFESPGGGTNALCWVSGGGNRILISPCGSSLRYKTAVQPFAPGLSLINRLRPISFNWKSNGAADFGLAAEDVAQVEPRLVTRNDKGEVEGVKYERLSIVLINAIKEQQAIIHQQQAENADLKARIEALERLVKDTQTARSEAR